MRTVALTLGFVSALFLANGPGPRASLALESHESNPGGAHDGAGKEDAQKPPPFVGDSLIQYIRDKKLERPVLVGHSLGGVLALWIASTIPQEVGPVISVDGLPFIPVRGTLAEARQRGVTVRDQYRKQSQEEFAKEVQDLLSKQIQDRRAAERVAEQAVRSDPKAVGQAIAEVPDLRDQVRAIRTPVLLLGQTYKDPHSHEKEKLYRSQLAAIPRHKVVMAPRAGHYIQLDEPAFFLREVDAFLQEAEKNQER